MADLAHGAQKYSVSDLDVSSVMVYPQMAEVMREWKCSLKQGMNEVIVENLSQDCVKDSIRVNGYGTSNCTITEVQYQEKFREDKLAEGEECRKKADKEFEDKLYKLNDQVQELEDEQKRVKRKREIIDGVASNLMIGGKDEKGQSKGHAMNAIKPDDVENLVSFMTTHEEQLTDCDMKLRKITKQLAELKEQVTAMKNEQTTYHLNNIRTNPYLNSQVLVKLDCTEDCDTFLSLVYLVNQARWSPKYDIRADSSAKKVKIIYYAIVNQTTGEEWNDSSLSLSTARPSPVKSLPKLPTLKVDFKYDTMVRGLMNAGPTKQRTKGGGFSFRKSSSTRRSRSEALADYDCDRAMSGYDGYSDCSEDRRSITIDFATTQVMQSSGGLSATYEIPHKCSISSGNTEHKVIVASVDLPAIYEHKCVPKITGKALLIAKLTNTSPYLFLPGPSSIFLDNCFVTDTTLEAVSPNEEFNCLLGMDEAVRVEYKPKQKYNERTGIITKYELERYKQIINIKNTKPIAVKIQVQEQVPISNNEQIKVTVLTPMLPKESKGDPNTTPVYLNSSNNVVWNVNIKPGKTETLTLSYSVEKPSGSRSLEYTDFERNY